ncbi:SAM-dependent methyltransferase [Rhodobacterales bacterium HKCCE2091]|nr:SAM-dependent methyltransferase [Rhodobacterales bacterium HKCCE2091]
MFDPKARERALARARPETARFLHDIARDEIEERLAEVNRTFTAPAVVTDHPGLWSDLLPGARVVAASPVLELEPGAHDLVLHAMSLHWAEDPVGQIVQSARALQPDGLFLAVSLGGETLSELRAVLGQAESEVMAGISPRVAPMAEIRDLGALIGRAGLALPVADSLRLAASYADLPALARDLRAMGETNAIAARLRRPTPRALFDRAGALYARAFPADDGRLRATYELVFLTGWKPHESQPRALRPGSAEARLADALNATEFDETGGTRE